VNKQIIGKSVKRRDGAAKVTGEAKFVADFFHPNTLWCKVVRSSQPHAKIKEIFTKDAENLPGVKGVITGKDCNYMIGDCLRDQRILAKDKVRFVGEPVAVVVAENEQIATQAVSLIHIDYEPIKAVFSPFESIKPDAPLIHKDLGNYHCLPGFYPKAGTNIFHHHKIYKGDLTKGFAQADLIVENSFSFPHLVHCQLEPHGCIALWEREGNLTVWTSSQSPHFVRRELSEVFNLPYFKVRVIVPFMGGGFGGKSDVTLEPLVAYVARFFPGKAIRLILEREEVFQATTLGRGVEGKIKTAVKQDGTLVASEIEIYFNSGAYGNCCINIITGAAQAACGPYEIPNLKIDAYGVYTNLPPVGAFRGYGHPEAHWIAERQMDLIARKLNLSPVEIRLKNALVPGKVNAIGQKITEHNGRIDQCIKKVAEALELEKPLRKKGNIPEGKGLAAYMKFPVMPTNAASSAILQINLDGTVSIVVSGTEMGQGAFTALAQIAAEALQIELEKVRITPVIDTDYTPYEWQTVASKTTWTVGNSIIMASQKAIEKMKAVASQVLCISPKEVVYKEGKFFSNNNPEKFLTWKELAAGYTFPDGTTIGGPIITSGYFIAPGVTKPDPETGQGNAAAEWTFGCNGAHIEVDPSTGAVKLKKLVCAMDVGKVINPQIAEAQLIGALIQSASSTLAEEIKYRQGKILNDNFTDYKIFSWNDLVDTEFKIIFIENPQPGGPFGARPLAEHGTVGTAPALANAIEDALGVEIHSLPLTREKIFALYKNKTR